VGLLFRQVRLLSQKNDDPFYCKRVSRLVEEDGRKIQEIEPGFDQLGMGNYDLYGFLDLSRIPRFPLRVSTLARRTAVRIPSLLRIR
jgi:hypothetical protein